MGKKSKKPTAFDYFTGSGKVGKAMKRYGVDKANFGGRPGEYGGGGASRRRMPEDVDNEIREAARNDYDTRRTLEAAAMSGKGKAKKILDSGFKNINDVIKSQNFMEKAAKRHGQGGDFSSGSDYMGLTQSMVERDRAKQTAEYDAKYASKDDLKDLKKVKTVDEQVEEAQYEPSEKIKQAKERVAGYKDGVTTDGDNDEQRSNAAESYTKYKLNLSTMK